MTGVVAVMIVITMLHHEPAMLQIQGCQDDLLENRFM